MLATLSRLFDPMVRLLMLALLLAIVVPVPVAYQDLGQWVANGAVFFLFLLNGLRLPRDQVLRGLVDWRFHEIARVEGPERIAPEWWRERSHIRLRDYYRIEDIRGQRYWIYRHGVINDGRGGLPDWYLQGLCA